MSETQSYKKASNCCTGNCEQGRKCPARQNSICEAELEAALWMVAISGGGFLGLVALVFASWCF